MRFFLDQDGDCHWYLVRADMRAEWDAWRELSGDDERSWVPPPCATALIYPPSYTTFVDPREERHP